MNKGSLATREAKSAITAMDPHEWVPGKIGTDIEAIVRHVVWQVQSMGLGKDDGGIEVLRASMRSQARNAAIFGDFASLVNKNMPIEVTVAGRDTALSTATSDDEYDHWRDRKERTAHELIEKGIKRLRQFPFNDFWDGRLWDRLTYNCSQYLLMEDGVELLVAVLDEEVPDTEHERAIAIALAHRFAEDIVKAEIIEEDKLLVAAAPGSLTDSRAEELDELRRILSAFIVVAEGDWIKCYKDTLPISFSWGGKLIQEVNQGNDELLADLRELAHPCERALRGEDVRRQVNEVMAKVLAKHFPSTIITGLTPATEIVLRTYQVDDENEASRTADSPLLDFLNPSQE